MFNKSNSFNRSVRLHRGGNKASHTIYIRDCSGWISHITILPEMYLHCFERHTLSPARTTELHLKQVLGNSADARYSNHFRLYCKMQ